MVIIYEDLKGVQQMLFTDSQNTSEPISWNLLKLRGNGTGFCKSKIQLIFRQVESGYTEAELQKTEMQHGEWKWWMKLVDDGNAHPKWLTPFFRGSILHISLSLYCFQNLTASVKQLHSLDSHQQLSRSRPLQEGTLSSQEKAQETHGVVGLILFHKGKSVCVLPEEWVVALCLGQTGIWINRWLIFMYNF